MAGFCLMADVTVIIPTFNRADFIGRAVASCLEQDCAVEVLVVDDGSTDGTLDVLQEVFPSVLSGDSPSSALGVGQADPRCELPGHSGGSVVRYTAQPNGGASAARNRGLARAQGEYVKFLDSDDELVPGALSRELSFARQSGCDVVVSGWEERTIGSDGPMTEESRTFMPAPRLDRGIDDMLLGECPWTAAALYRLASVRHLRWDEHCRKAEEWLWAWDVCISGATFGRLDIPSAVYIHRPIARITASGDVFADSTRWRQYILRHVEEELAKKRLLSPARRQALVQYYYKDSKVICEWSRRDWSDLWVHCQRLASGFEPIEYALVPRTLNSLFGTYRGVCLYVWLRSIARRLGIRSR